MVETVYCVHCGAVAKHPVTKVIAGQARHFCCNGCLQVYEMILEEGLSAGLQPARPIAPAGTAAESITLVVSGMTCANCVTTVTRSLSAVPGVLQASVDLASARASLTLVPGKVTQADLQRAVRKVGYDVEAI